MVKRTQTHRVSMSISRIKLFIKILYSLKITHSDRSPIPARSAVQSNITSWQLQKLSRRALNKSIELTSTTCMFYFTCDRSLRPTVSGHEGFYVAITHCLKPAPGYQLTNEHTNKRNNKQTQRIAIPAGGGSCACQLRSVCMPVTGVVGKLTNARHQYWTLAMQWVVHWLQFPVADGLRSGSLVALSTLDQ